MYDILIKNGMICDGTGADVYRADLGIVGEQIAAIGNLQGAEAITVIDAEGKVVTPGFIEPHSHVDLSILMNPRAEAYLQQGVTTVVGGNCGHSMGIMGDELYRSAVMDFALTAKAAPSYFNLVNLLLPRADAAAAFQELYGIDMNWHTLGEYVDVCNERGMDVNIVPLAGYSAIRNAVMGADSMREATEEELVKLEECVRQAMEDGAFGFSTGLDPQYVPGLFATDEETIRMLKIVKEYDGIFTSHTFNTRADGSGNRMDGYRTMLEQAMAAGIRTNVSHVHVIGMAADAESAVQAAKNTLEYFYEMKEKGLDLSYDVIPSAEAIDFTIPYFAFFLRPFVLISGTRKYLAENFKVPDFRKMVHTVIDAGMFPVFDPKQPVNYYKMIMVTKHRNPRYVGKVFETYAQELGVNPLDLMMDMFAEDPDMEANAGAAFFDEANDILTRDAMAMPCADGFSCGVDSNYTGDEEIPLYPNPMNISFIARYLTMHGKERFEDTIHQITQYPAQRFGIEKRGVLKEGNYADVVVLSREKLHSYDKSENPLQYPEGFDAVIVNGTLTIQNKQHLDVMAGRMLRKNAQ